MNKKITNTNIIVFILLLFIQFDFACVAKKNIKPVVPKPSPPQFERIDLPASIAFDKRFEWKLVLENMDFAHPDRKPLIQKIAKGIVLEFEKSKTKPSYRLELFIEVMHLHKPLDFRKDHVCDVAQPMAEWVVSFYKKRGDEALALAAYNFLILLSDDAEIETEYERLMKWTQDIRNTINDPLERIESLVKVFTRKITIVPDLETAHLIAKLLVKKFKLLYLDKPRERLSSRALMRKINISKLIALPENIIFPFFAAGKIQYARKYIEELIDAGDSRVAYLELLDNIIHGKDRSNSFFAIADRFIYIDKHAALRACLLARKHSPDEYMFSVCAGRIHDSMENPESAIFYYMEAARRKPGMEVLAYVLPLFRESFYNLHLVENEEDTLWAIAKGDELVNISLSLDGKDGGDADMIIPGVAVLLYTLGQVAFDMGDIPSSRKYFTKCNEQLSKLSIEQLPPEAAVVLYKSILKLAHIHTLLGEYKKSVDLLDKTLVKGKSGSLQTPAIRAMLLEEKADALVYLLKNSRAEKLYNQALALWGYSKMTKIKSPQVSISQGILLDKMGRFDDSLKSFELAVKLDPDSSHTYTRLISFLVLRRRIDDAIAFYQIAYNQDRIKPMWKIYYSLWVASLIKRNGQKKNSLAENFLENVKGETWQGFLAEFYSKKIDYEKLKKKAVNKGQKAEADFYAALVALGQNKKSMAKNLLNNVIESHLLGYFEYQMARTILLEELK